MAQVAPVIEEMPASRPVSRSGFTILGIAFVVGIKSWDAISRCRLG